MALGATGDPALVERIGEAVGQELRALGINTDFAPVADVNNNPRNPVIGTRSFGESPERVGALVVAFARGLRSAGVAATAKHFPGHGDTQVDSHLDLPTIPHDLDRLRAVELAALRRRDPRRGAAGDDLAHPLPGIGAGWPARDALAAHPQRPLARRDGLRGRHHQRRDGDEGD